MGRGLLRGVDVRCGERGCAWQRAIAAALRCEFGKHNEPQDRKQDAIRLQLLCEGSRRSGVKPQGRNKGKGLAALPRRNNGGNSVVSGVGAQESNGGGAKRDHRSWQCRKVQTPQGARNVGPDAARCSAPTLECRKVFSPIGNVRGRPSESERGKVTLYRRLRWYRISERFC